MSSLPKPRLTRNPTPKGKFREHTYRAKALPYLLKETGDRCAYSLRHVKLTGETSMEVDHFNPKKKGAARHAYKNLLASERTCNLAKSNWWPKPKEAKRGIRLIHPYEELDYGQHIFEDPETHEVFGVTPTGKYHVLKLDLNAIHFVDERRRRSELRSDCGKAKRIKAPLGVGSETVVKTVNSFQETIELSIPPLPIRKRPKIAAL